MIAALTLRLDCGRPRRHLHIVRLQILGQIEEQTTSEACVAQLAEEIAHAIRMYPRYDIFDWVDGTVHNGVVILTGAVREPYRKDDYGKMVEEIAGEGDPQ